MFEDPLASLVSFTDTIAACMRMRKLGQGQSVVFCIPQEIQDKIRERNDASDLQISKLHVLEWAISETNNDTRKSMPLWAVQGQRFERQRRLWRSARVDSGICMTKAHAEEFLEAEAQTLEQRYRPRLTSDEIGANIVVTDERLRQIHDHCQEVGTTKFDEVTLQEEQERELSPETEQERQIQRPAPAESAKHDIHPDLRRFISSGKLPLTSSAFIPAFETLRKTSAAEHLDVGMFPKDVLVTGDFASTIKTARSSDLLDDYQRPIQWILMRKGKSWKHIVIISPHEAQELLPLIESSGKTTLHLYAPRPNLEIRPLDGLDLYTVPSSSMQAMEIPEKLRIQLNLYAGQLYFRDFAEYAALCNMLRLSCKEADEGTEVATDGFILSSPLRISDSTNGFTKSPVEFLKVFLMKARRDCQPIHKTHLGKLLDGALLQDEDFQIQGR